MIKKVGLIILISITILNLILPITSVFADTAEPKKENLGEVANGISGNSVDSIMNDGKAVAHPEGGDKVLKLTTGTSEGGATASAFMTVLNIIPTLLSSIMTYLVNSQQLSGTANMEYTIQDLLSNKYDMFSIDFFANVNETRNVTGKLTQQVVVWYSAVRNLAITLTLLVLVYVGIRMAISTVADDKAKYKNMLIAWVKGFCMIFVLIYIIVIAINISNAIIELIPKSSENLESTLMYGNGGTEENPEEGTIMEQLSTLKGWNYVAISILYWAVVYYQVKFFILYFKRVLSVGLLLIIAPLISVTYPIDVVGDNKAQGYNTWLRETLINIFIQPLHLIVYMVFMTTASAIIEVAPVLAVILFFGLSRGEKIVKNIFGIRGARSISSLSGIHLAPKNIHRA